MSIPRTDGTGIKIYITQQKGTINLVANYFIQKKNSEKYSRWDSKSFIWNLFSRFNWNIPLIGYILSFFHNSYL